MLHISSEYHGKKNKYTTEHTNEVKWYEAQPDIKTYNKYNDLESVRRLFGYFVHDDWKVDIKSRMR